MKKRSVAESHTPRGQNNYSDDEKLILLKAHKKGVTAEDLTKVLDRDVASITSAASRQGVSLGQLRQ